MLRFFKHEICDDIPQLLVLELQVVKPPKLHISELIVRDEGHRLAIGLEWLFSPAMEGHDADAKTAAYLAPAPRPCRAWPGFRRCYASSWSSPSTPIRGRREEVLACVRNGNTPRLFGIEPPRPRLEAVKIVDMSASNSWAKFAATYRRTRPAHQEHEEAKANLKKLVPEDAKEATGHGLKAKRSNPGAISFDLLEAADEPQQ